MATAAEKLRTYGIVTPEVTAEEIAKAQNIGDRELETVIWDNPLIMKFGPVFDGIAEKAAAASGKAPAKIDVTARMGFFFGITFWKEAEGDFTEFALGNTLRMVENYTGFAF